MRYKTLWNSFQMRKGKKSNMAKKKTVEKALNIDSILFNCRDYLRAARNSGSFFEKRDMMLTLVFLRFIGEKYEDGIEKLKQTLIEQGLDPEDENIRAAFFDDATFADGTYNLPPEARWSTIINTPAPGLNVALDTALQRLEEEDPQLKGCFVKGTFTARNLAANDIKKIVDEVNKISHKAFGEEKDLIGRVIGDHHFRPMYHRCHIETELMYARVQCISLFHLIQSIGNAMESGQHTKRLGVAYNLHSRILLAEQANATRMVRLHVIDNQIIQRASLQSLSYLLQEKIRIADIDRVDQDRLFIDDQISVVRHTVGQRPHVLEERLLAVV